MKVTITWLKREDKTSAAGKPWTSLSIKTKEHADKYLSGFGNADNKNWIVGMEAEIAVVEKKVGDKTYLNFETPKKADLQNEEVKKEINSLALKFGVINNKLDKIIDHLAGNNRLDRTSDGKPLPTI